MRMKLSALAMVAVGALASASAHAQQTKVAVGYASANDFLPMYVAKEKGFFAKRNIDAEPTRIPVATNIPAALMAGSLQIGMTTPPILLLAAEGGLDLVLVAGASRHLKSNPMLGLVARKEIKIDKAADLKGKKVGVPGINSAADVLFRKWLLNNKVALTDVTFVEAIFPQMPDLLKAGTVDAVLAVEPIRTRIASGGIGYIAAEYVAEVSPDLFLTGWISTGAWAAKNPEVVKGFREAIAEGLAWIGTNAAEAQEIEKKYLGFTAPKFPPFTTAVKPEDLNLHIEILKELGVLRKPVDAGKLVLK